MKVVAIGLLIILLLKVSQSNAQEISNPPLKMATPFSSGEKLTYQVKYGFIVGGFTTFTLSDTIYKNKPVFHAMAIGQTSGIANMIYGVKDIYESWFDKENTLPYKQIRNIKEGRYTQYNEVIYNRRDNTVQSKSSGEHQVPEKILDLCSTFYYIRRVDFSKMTEGDILFVNMYFGDEVFPFHLRYIGRETIRTKNGKMNCIKIRPIVEVGRMFETKDDMTIWFSDDDKCIPVLVRMELRIVGAVILKLVKYENVNDAMANGN
ncbi:MAG: DUF3108 domain-containing protein [Prolixibacteraceae bacterium]|jgi:hypothetical protein|nr:DUF3108 domain-containing protein [Prolixibacteraceae bacterium]